MNKLNKQIPSTLLILLLSGLLTCITFYAPASRAQEDNTQTKEINPYQEEVNSLRDDDATAAKNVKSDCSPCAANTHQGELTANGDPTGTVNRALNAPSSSSRDGKDPTKAQGN